VQFCKQVNREEIFLIVVGFRSKQKKQIRIWLQQSVISVSALSAFPTANVPDTTIGCKNENRKARKWFGHTLEAFFNTS
jgi:hypothetical protein